MGLISKILRRTTTGFIWWCPGCGAPHSINVGASSGPNWTWNGDPDRPTFAPSVLVRGIRRDMTNEEEAQYDKDAKELTNDQLMDHPVYGLRCHSFVDQGQMRFLPDCSHQLAGQTVPIPDWPYTPEEFNVPTLPDTSDPVA